jgi:hypothetical protein
MNTEVMGGMRQRILSYMVRIKVRRQIIDGAERDFHFWIGAGGLGGATIPYWESVGKCALMENSVIDSIDKS